LVLQHNPPPITLAILSKAFAGLPSNGVSIFHLPTHLDGYRFKIAAYLEGPLGQEMEMHATPQKAQVIAFQHNCCLLEIHEEPGHLTSVTNTFVFQKR
jgi:hypothetical protein